jgi:hypothetical protein
MPAGIVTKLSSTNVGMPVWLIKNVTALVETFFNVVVIRPLSGIRNARNNAGNISYQFDRYISMKLDNKTASVATQ